MVDLTGYGNERLKPMALGGDGAAEWELETRGNVLLKDGAGEYTGVLEKRTKRTRHVYVDGKFIKKEEIEEVIQDGRLVSRSIDGQVVQPAPGEL